MVIKGFVVSPVQSNCYVLSESLDAGARAVIIDPGDIHLDAVLEYISSHSFQVVENWNTHAHFDHVMGVDIMRDTYDIQSSLHEADMEIWNSLVPTVAAWTGQEVAPLRRVDRVLSDGDELRLGESVFTVWHTPGHSPGSICMVGEDVAFTGDTLFAGTVGRTDLPGSSPDALRHSLERLRDLPENLRLFPGHMHATTMKKELADNPFLISPERIL